MNTSDLQQLIKDYRERFNHAGHLSYYRDQPTLEQAIECAALAYRGPDKKRHSHQNRLSRDVLAEMRARLLEQSERLRGCTSFDNIYRLVRELRPKGFGPLATYDTALRLGAHLRLLPERVYLHAGAEIGAAALGLPSKGAALEIEALPAPLRALSAHEIEDFLCLYKAHLSTFDPTQPAPPDCVPKPKQKPPKGVC